MFLDGALLSSFDSSMHTNAAVTQSVWDWQSPQAGVYDNAWGDLDTTPHTWSYSEPGSIEPEGYYAGLAQTNASTSLAGYDGTCNSMPGWEPSFNPQSGGGCTLNPMYGQPGLGSGAAFGSGVPALAPLAPIETPTEARTAKAGPGHLLLMGNAVLLGAITATTNALERGDGSWVETFQTASARAASAVTPVGGALLQTK
mmetsp:Transcript_43317/g.87078  ORF Transcript_43317/g.87078 Transcript_43317/m.87078 type:complete len:200 (-) Transcript_43317:176-775(-)